MKTITTRMPDTVVACMVADPISIYYVRNMRYVRSMRIELLAYTGAKLCYRGGGWWRISGYAADNSDVDTLIKEVLL